MATATKMGTSGVTNTNAYRDDPLSVYQRMKSALTLLLPTEDPNHGPDSHLLQSSSTSVVDASQYTRAASGQEPLSACGKDPHVERVASSTQGVLAGREGEFARIGAFLDQHVHDARGGALYVSGLPGTGKTAAVMTLFRSFQVIHSLFGLLISLHIWAPENRAAQGMV